jgi:hypothetical protein
MPNRHPGLSLVAQCSSRIERAKAELQHARTKAERNLVKEKIGLWERRQHEVRVAQRRAAP